MQGDDNVHKSEASVRRKARSVMESTLRGFRDWRPELGARVYVDPAATVIGRVRIGDDASV